jgi:hypothetical protein
MLPRWSAVASVDMCLCLDFVPIPSVDASRFRCFCIKPRRQFPFSLPVYPCVCLFMIWYCFILPGG